MRQILFCVLLGMLVIGCNNDKRIKPVGFTFGYLLAKMNGEPWIRTNKKSFQTTRGIIGTSGSATPCLDEYQVIESEMYGGVGYSTQNLHFVKVPIAKGKYKVVPYVNGTCNTLDPIYGYFDTMIDGDVSGDYYRILTGEDNFLQVESYNPKSKEIKGTFQLTFVLERAGSDHTLPDTMRFTDGRFFTKIMDLRRR